MSRFVRPRLPWPPPIRRVHFFDRPKGERHGEALRHQVLQEARGEIICYLSEDDLWLPDHVEWLAQALENADFAHALPVYITASGKSGVHYGHLGAPASRARVCGGVNFIPLSAAAHTRSFYRRLLSTVMNDCSRLLRTSRH